MKKLMRLSLLLIFSIQAHAFASCPECQKLEELKNKMAAADILNKKTTISVDAELDATHDVFEKRLSSKAKINSAEFQAMIALAVEANLHDVETEVAELAQQLIYSAPDLKLEFDKLNSKMSADCKWQAFASSVLEHRCNSRGDIPKEQAKLDKNPECKNRKFVDYRACLKAAKTK